MQNNKANEDFLAGKPPYRRLFLDSMVSEGYGGLSRVFHAAKKYQVDPIIKKEHPWEGWGPYLYGTVMWDDGKLKMWYHALGKESCDVSYAESEDGIHWTKPNLGIIEYNGSKDNNIVGPKGAAHIPSVIKKSDGQWFMYGHVRDVGICVTFSEDGFRWDWDRKPEQQNLFETSDVINVFYDPYTQKFTASFKTENRRLRSVGIATSEDGLKWQKPIDGAVFTADDYDPDDTQIYGMPVFPYQGCYIGLPWIYHSRLYKYGEYSPQRMYEAQEGSPCTVDIQLAWSWDLINWNRTAKREPFIELGNFGTWDGGQIYTARGPVVVGDELYFYYGGFDKLHDDVKGEVNTSIGLATLRLDGFCSMRADKEEGWLISRREVFNTPKVAINAGCDAGGYVAAELLDRNNNVIPGFSKADCVGFSGDSVQGELKWKTESFPQEWIDKDKKVKFYVKNASLYSYLPENINREIDNG